MLVKTPPTETTATQTQPSGAQPSGALPPGALPARTIHRLQIWLALTVAYVTDALTSRLAAGKLGEPANDNDRGDVPGWVMITVMTALVVLGLLTIFRDQVKAAVTQAFDSIRKAT